MTILMGLAVFVMYVILAILYGYVHPLTVLSTRRQRWLVVYDAYVLVRRLHLCVRRDALMHRQEERHLIVVSPPSMPASSGEGYCDASIDRFVDPDDHAGRSVWRNAHRPWLWS